MLLNSFVKILDRLTNSFHNETEKILFEEEEFESTAGSLLYLHILQRLC